MRALKHTLSHSIMASNRLRADGPAGPAQQTVVEWIYIQSLHFLLLLLWSLMNSRESMEPINVLWSMEAPCLKCNPYSTGHGLVFCAGWVRSFFICVSLCVEVQWFSGGSVRACACISGPVRNREPLSESNTVRERKSENGLGNEPLSSRRCGYRVSTGRLQHMRQWE